MNSETWTWLQAWGAQQVDAVTAWTDAVRTAMRESDGDGEAAALYELADRIITAAEEVGLRR